VTAKRKTKPAPYPFRCVKCDTSYGCESSVLTITVYCPVCRTENAETKARRLRAVREAHRA
jgi:hypothetical protein